MLLPLDSRNQRAPPARVLWSSWDDRTVASGARAYRPIFTPAASLWAAMSRPGLALKHKSSTRGTLDDAQLPCWEAVNVDGVDERADGRAVLVADCCRWQGGI